MSKPNSLVSTSWLQQQIRGGGSTVVLEVLSDPDLPDEPGDHHIPGARSVFWKDLCWHDSDRQFPTPDEMAQRLAALGISDSDTIAVVGEPFQYGAYAYWVLTMTGQESRTVYVDGGRETWLAEGRELGPSARDVVPGHVTAGDLDETSRLGRRDVLARLDDPGVLLIDVRSPEEFSGERVSPDTFEIDYGAERLGRIPGAVHLYYLDLLDEDGTFLDREALSARFKQLPIDVEEIVLYCRLSHRATLAWFALTRILDYSNVRVYDGSWTEWGTIVGYPVER